MTLSLEERKYQREAKRKQRLNPDFVSLEYERNRKWREENKETISENKRLYYIKNKDRLVAYKKKASEERKKRNVSWDTELTSFVFKEAKDLVKRRKSSTGILWEVDHIIPLCGKTVSGLHMWNNLAVIPAVENKRKYNLYDNFS